MLLPRLVIVRGLPGSGKTTFAQQLSGETGAILVEPDCLVVRGGKYEYTPDNFWCARVTALRILAAVASMGADCIYADVLPRQADVATIIQTYKRALPDQFVGACCVDIAESRITPEESMERNRHGVRSEDILRMAAEWEEWTPGYKTKL